MKEAQSRNSTRGDSRFLYGGHQWKYTTRKGRVLEDSEFRSPSRAGDDGANDGWCSACPVIAEEVVRRAVVDKAKMGGQVGHDAGRDEEGNGEREAVYPREKKRTAHQQGLQ